MSTSSCIIALCNRVFEPRRDASKAVNAIEPDEQGLVSGRGNKAGQEVDHGENVAALYALIRLKPAIVCFPKIVRRGTARTSRVLMTNETDHRRVNSLAPKNAVESKHGGYPRRLFDFELTHVPFKTNRGPLTQLRVGLGCALPTLRNPLPHLLWGRGKGEGVTCVNLIDKHSRAGWFLAESIWDSHFGANLIQHAGWRKEASMDGKALFD